MEKVYCVSVRIDCDEWFDTREIETEYHPTTLFKTMESASKYIKLLHDNFSNEFPELNHSVTEKHACIWEDKPKYASVDYNPLKIWIGLKELYIHD